MSTVDSAGDERTVNNTMRHQYRVLTDDEKADMLSVKDAGQQLLDLLDSIEGHARMAQPSKNVGRPFALARTKVEEAVMWAVKGITG